MARMLSWLLAAQGLISDFGGPHVKLDLGEEVAASRTAHLCVREKALPLSLSTSLCPTTGGVTFSDAWLQRRFSARTKAVLFTNLFCDLEQSILSWNNNVKIWRSGRGKNVLEFANH